MSSGHEITWFKKCLGARRIMYYTRMDVPSEVMESSKSREFTQS